MRFAKHPVSSQDLSVSEENEAGCCGEGRVSVRSTMEWMECHEPSMSHASLPRWSSRPTLSLVRVARRRECHLFDDIPWLPGMLALGANPLAHHPRPWSISSAIRQRASSRAPVDLGSNNHHLLHSQPDSLASILSFDTSKAHLRLSPPAELLSYLPLRSKR
jgi:hypothetical protein